MRFPAIYALALTLFCVSGQAAAETFSLIGEWVGTNNDGVTVRYAFKPDNKVIWTVVERDNPSETDTDTAQYTVEGQNPVTLDMHHFINPRLRGITFRGIVEVLSPTKFRMDVLPSNLGSRPATFGTNSTIFVPYEPPLPPGTRIARVGDTTYTNIVVESWSAKTVTFAHSRGVASLNISKLTAAERQVFRISDPPPEKIPTEPQEKKQINVSSLPLKGVTILKIFLYSLFGGVAPFLIRIAAGIMHVEEITAWRCFRAGMGGAIGFGGAMMLGAHTGSVVLGVAFMALLWMATIQTALKTSIPKTFVIWLMTHGTLFLAGMTVSHFFDVRGGLMQIVAMK